MKQRMGSAPGQTQSTGQLSQPPSKHKTGEGKVDKVDKQQKRPQTPFHHRSLSDDSSIETETPASQSLTMTVQDGARFTGIRSADMSSIQKAPQIHSGVVSTGPSEQTNSPQPPPLSPHPSERNDESGEVTKNPSSPNSQHFYQPPPEPCLVGVKATDSSEENGGSESLNQHFHSHHPNPGISSFSEPPEPTIYAGTGVNLEDDSLHTPWSLFKLPHRKEANLATPLLPGDKLRDEASGFQDGFVTATEWVMPITQSVRCLGVYSMMGCKVARVSYR